MDFVDYAERAAELVNTPFGCPDDVRTYLDDRIWLREQVADRDHTALTRFQAEVRPVFAATGPDDHPLVIASLNDLLGKHPITPYISGDGPDTWHMHVANKASSVPELLIAEALMGLATLACDLGPQRLGECDGSGCDNVYVDTSPNQSRRYCSDRCSSRANVAAYRARQKAAML